MLINSSQATLILSGYRHHCSTHMCSWTHERWVQLQTLPSLWHLADISPSSIFPCRCGHESPSWSILRSTDGNPMKQTALSAYQGVLLTCALHAQMAHNNVTNVTVLLPCHWTVIGKIYLQLLDLLCLSFTLCPPEMSGSSRFLEPLRGNFGLSSWFL